MTTFTVVLNMGTEEVLQGLPWIVYTVARVLCHPNYHRSGAKNLVLASASS